MRVCILCHAHITCVCGTCVQLWMWDDHDIYDGFGSYPSKLQQSPVFQGLFAIAKRFYLLFQHHTTEANARQQNDLIGHQ
jgi:PhoD related phosphatase